MAWKWRCAVVILAFFIVGGSNAMFVDRINSLKNCPGRCTCPLLYHADCRNRGLRHLNSVIFSDSGKKVRGLWLDNNRIRTLNLNVFENLTILKYLSLSNNLLKCLTKNVFDNSVYLTLLNLSKNKLEFLSSNLFKSLTRLKTLNLSYNNIKVIDGELLNPLTNIENLYLSGNRFDCSNCILEGAVEFTKKMKKRTDATCETPIAGESWSDHTFFNCFNSNSTLDPSSCIEETSDFDSDNKEFESIFTLPIILAITFAVITLLIVLGILIFCCIRRKSKPEKRMNQMLEYDDINASELSYYETINQFNLNDHRYISITSSTVPNIPERPKNRKVSYSSNDYDDIYFTDLTRSASYIEPEPDTTPKERSSSDAVDYRESKKFKAHLNSTKMSRNNSSNTSLSLKSTKDNEFTIQPYDDIELRRQKTANVRGSLRVGRFIQNIRSLK